MRRVVLLVMAVSLLSGCALWSSPKVSEQPAFLMHVVLVWLKQPGNTTHRRQIMQASQALREIPGVLDLHVGEVVQSERAVVEDSYDVALSLRFANQADLQAYLRHPIHVQAVKQSFVPIMQRYQVLDFASGAARSPAE